MNIKTYLLLFILVFIVSNIACSQKIPSDSFLLSTIFGCVDKTKNTVTKNYTNEATKIHPDDKLIYSIILKDFCQVENEQLLIVICRAEGFNLHGHPFGLTNKYLLKQFDNTWKIIHSAVQHEEEMSPIGDDNAISIVEIGQHTSALLFTFNSTGNHHLENNISIYQITVNSYVYIGNIDISYSNESWIDLEATPDTAECMAYGYESTYEIIPSQKDWYDIKLTQQTRTYDKGCKNELLEENEIIYSYFNGSYKKSEK